MMFCKKCGKKLEDGAAFCPGCGAAAESPSGGVRQSATNPPAAGFAPAGGETGSEMEPKSRKVWLLPAAIGGAAVACLLAAVLFSGMISGAKGSLIKAVTKSAAAWQAAVDTLELPDLTALYKDQQVSQKMTVQLKSVSDDFGAEAKMLEGMSLTVEEGLDLPGRRMDLSVSANYGPAELLSARISGEDNIFTLECPALLGDRAYGADTETLGQDLARLNPEDAEDVENISFNIFDIVQAQAKPIEIDAAATEALNDAIAVEKTGSPTIDVNGTSMKCDGYRVTIPRDAMLVYLDAIRAACDAREKNEAMLDIMRSFGASEEELDAMTEPLGYADMFDHLEELLEEVGGLELDVYVSNGYVAAVIWENGEDSIHACFGGGENYVDDLYLEIRTADGSFTLTSSGNHSASGGAYTDTAVLSVTDGDLGTFSLESRLSYDPRQPSDNFSWTLASSGVSLSMTGQLTGGKDNLFLDLDQFSVSALGAEYMRLGLSWSVGPYVSQSTPSNPVMLSGMTAEDLGALYYDVSINAQSWLLDLMSQTPELFQLFM